MRRRARAAIAIAGVGCLLAVGCATVTRSKSDDQLFVDSSPPGASIFVDGGFAGTTPQLVRMPRDRTISVVCKLEGHEDSSTTIHREVAPATAFDDPVFAVVDTLTGAAYRLDRRRLFVELTPLQH